MRTSTTASSNKKRANKRSGKTGVLLCERAHGGKGSMRACSRKDNSAAPRSRSMTEGATERVGGRPAAMAAAEGGRVREGVRGGMLEAKEAVEMIQAYQRALVARRLQAGRNAEKLGFGSSSVARRWAHPGVCARVRACIHMRRAYDEHVDVLASLTTVLPALPKLCMMS